jgi:aminopeptidase N
LAGFPLYRHAVRGSFRAGGVALCAVMTDADSVTLRAAYQQLPVVVSSISLSIDIAPDCSTTVHSSLCFALRAGCSIPSAGLLLHGRSDVHLVSLAVNGRAPPPETYAVSKDGLHLSHLCLLDRCDCSEWVVDISVTIRPQDNTQLEGLYASGGVVCSQCEPEGFRSITYFFDRPDVMCTWRVRIEADKVLHPVLLSNGNLTASGALGPRHFVEWFDPFPKPSYLFAVVAGNLALTADHFTTRSGRLVSLRVWTQDADKGKVAHALRSLAKAMKWDEDTFGLEYDLGVFNIVAVDDFNMGAMENKSLNIFNTRLILSTPQTSTDCDFADVESVVAHEYFHNWSERCFHAQWLRV